MQNTALPKLSKQSSNDSQTFPSPRAYMVEDLAGCEPFKVYLGKPEENDNGWYIWHVDRAEDEKLTIVIYSAVQRREYHDGKGFIARLPCSKSKTVPQAFLNPVEE